jgi:Domain of unknown function (DUF4388)
VRNSEPNTQRLKKAGRYGKRNAPRSHLHATYSTGEGLPRAEALSPIARLGRGARLCFCGLCCAFVTFGRRDGYATGMSEREDRLRIDATGTVHPVGREASHDLRAREGEWRVLPSPSEVMLLVPAGARRSVRWAGEVRAPGALSDVFTLAAQASWHGELLLHTESGVRSIFFDAGNVVASHTTIPQERLGEILFRSGVFPSRAELTELLSACEQSGKRLGEAVIELGITTSEALFPMMGRQIEEVVFGALRADEGTFAFLEGFDVSSIKGSRFSLNTGALLMEAARRMDELAFFRERVPSDAHIASQIVGVKVPSAELAPVYEKCDGARNVAEIGIELGMLEFELTKALYQLVSAGLVRLTAARPKGPEAVILAMNPALSMIHERCDAHKRGAELRAGLERFATGGGVYDPLFQGAGPLPNGTFREARVARNMAAFASTEEDAWLLQLMHDYVGFALFQTESLLPRDDQRALATQVMAMIVPLMPHSDRPSAIRSRPPSTLPLDLEWGVDRDTTPPEAF